MTYKKRPKNKESIPPNSGVRKKPIYKKRVIFEFEREGQVLRNVKDPVRLKVMQDGGISFLIQTEKGWIPIKGDLISIKMVKERVKKTK